MKFTVISHACLYIEHLNIRLLIDPWVIGSCYWRSWWNYPEPKEELIKSLNPTHIYITHLHWDHYHGPSLRLFENINPQIILPKHFNKRMLGDCCKSFKFKNVIEINHGEKYNLGKSFYITSYQFNPFCIDSSLVVEADNTTLLNANDSKVFGLSLKQIISNHKKFDFIFRSHSTASPLPHCIRGEKPEISNRSPLEYAEEFASFAEATRCKYAIPFASSHIYLHDKSKRFNRFYTNPEIVKNIFEKKNNNKQNCILMPSGSYWESKKGFELVKHDYSKIDLDIKYLYKEKSNKLERQNNIEKKILLNKKAFHKYFKSFLKTHICLFSTKFRFGYLIYQHRDKKLFLCLVDGKEKRTEIHLLNKESEIYDYNLSFTIRTPIYTFNDCNTKLMYNTFTPSKLLEIILIDKKAKKNLSNLLALLDIYENDCLPLLKLVNIRNLNILIRRWREVFDIFIYIYIMKLRAGKIADLYKI